jgi:hypothetical protein
VIGSRSIETGEVEWHGDGQDGTDYTLCGLAIDGDMYTPLFGSQRINCPQCKRVWLSAQAFRASDFEA